MGLFHSMYSWLCTNTLLEMEHIWTMSAKELSWQKWMSEMLHVLSWRRVSIWILCNLVYVFPWCLSTMSFSARVAMESSDCHLVHVLPWSWVNVILVHVLPWIRVSFICARVAIELSECHLVRVLPWSRLRVFWCTCCHGVEWVIWCTCCHWVEWASFWCTCCHGVEWVSFGARVAMESSVIWCTGCHGVEWESCHSVEWIHWTHSLLGFTIVQSSLFFNQTMLYYVYNFLKCLFSPDLGILSF